MDKLPLSDTSPEAERVQIGLLRQATPSKRLGLMCALSACSIGLSRRALARARPELSHRDLQIAFVELHYGKDLADKLRLHLAGKQTMAAPEIWVALKPVAAAFERLGVKYYVGGSVASSAYGIARATMDVDLVADLKQPDIDPLCNSLQPAYYVSRSAVAEAVARKSCFNVIHLETMLKVDVFVAGNRRYDAIAIERIRQDTFDEDDPATRFWLAAPEDVVLSKLEWFRLGGEVSERQWNDVIGVLKIQKESLDRDYLQHWASELDLADLLATAFSQAEEP